MTVEKARRRLKYQDVADQVRARGFELRTGTSGASPLGYMRKWEVVMFDPISGQWVKPFQNLWEVVAWLEQFCALKAKALREGR